MRGLYLITSEEDFDALVKKIALALHTGGVALLQYRRKHTAYAQQAFEIEKIRQLCQRHAVPLIINDDLQLAQQFDCGLHLGQNDGSLLEARQVLGAHAIIGRTCHASLLLAEQAVQEGASYVAFGAVFASATKPDAPRISLQALVQARQRFKLPICAIGGLSVENSAPLLEAGVDLLAVVGDVFHLPVAQLENRLQQWQQLFSCAGKLGAHDPA